MNTNLNCAFGLLVVPNTKNEYKSELCVWFAVVQ